MGFSHMKRNIQSRRNLQDQVRVGREGRVLGREAVDLTSRYRGSHDVTEADVTALVVMMSPEQRVGSL